MHIVSDNAQIYYEERGVGDTLVLLHGNGEDHSVFAEQIAFFAPRFRVIAIDSRGHGQSLQVTGKLTYEAMADDVENLLAALGVEKYRIIGFSDGGIVALLLAMRTPEKIAQMILIGTNYRPSGLKFWVRLSVFTSYLACACAYYFGECTEKWKWKQELMQLMLFQPHISEESLQRITVKTLLVVGDRDMVRFSHTQKLTSLLPNSRLQVLKNCTHFVLRQQGEIFNRLADGFFNSLLL